MLIIKSCDMILQTVAYQKQVSLKPKVFYSFFINHLHNFHPYIYINLFNLKKPVG